MASKGLLTLILGARTTGFDQALGKSGRRLKTFNTTVNMVSRALGALGLAFTAGAVLRDATRRIIAFDKSMVNLAAILRVNREEMAALEQQAIDLGGSTLFTANQVGELQTVLARFGFSQTEIEASTKAILDLAAAAGIETSQAADIAAQSLRAFGLDASEMTRVVDVMTNAFTTSALDVESFGESMKFAAPIAAAAGTSIEETAAMLAILADNGLRGSIAGTSLRRIFTELSQKGKTLTQVFQETGGNAEFIADAMGFADDAVGKYALSSFLVLAKNNELLAETTEQMGELGTASKTAEAQFESFSAKITLMKSAWEGLVLTLEDGENAIGDASKQAVDDATAVLIALKNLAGTMESRRASVTEEEEARGQVGLIIPRGMDDRFAALANLWTMIGNRAREYNIEVEKANENVDKHTDHVDEQTAIYEEQQRKIREAARKRQEEEAAAAVAASEAKTKAEEKFRKEQEKLAKRYEENQLKMMAKEAGFQVGKIVHLNEQKGIYEEIWAITKRIAELPPPMSGTSAPVTSEDRDIVTTPAATGAFNLADHPDLMATIEAVGALGDAYEDLKASALEAAQAMGQSFTQGANSFKDWANQAVDSIFQVISALIMKQVIESTAALPGIGAFLIPAAIGAAIGLAKTAKNQLFTAFADGGIVKGPTLGLVGEYSGASTNPEVIAPLSDLQKYMGGSMVQVEGEFVLKNRTLVAAVKNGQDTLTKYGG